MLYAVRNWNPSHKRYSGAAWCSSAEEAKNGPYRRAVGGLGAPDPRSCPMAPNVHTGSAALPRTSPSACSSSMQTRGSFRSTTRSTNTMRVSQGVPNGDKITLRQMADMTRGSPTTRRTISRARSNHRSVPGLGARRTGTGRYLGFPSVRFRHRVALLQHQYGHSRARPGTDNRRALPRTNHRTAGPPRYLFPDLTGSSLPAPHVNAARQGYTIQGQSSDSLRGYDPARLLLPRGRLGRAASYCDRGQRLRLDHPGVTFPHAVAAVRRGYNCLTFDGLGQGRALIKENLHMRPDWENVVAPVVDYTLSRPEVDPERVALVGWSFGGYLAPRAASGEHRLAACIADPGQWDMIEALKGIFGGFGIPQEVVERLPAVEPQTLAPFFEAVDKSPQLAWTLKQRGLWVHGVDSVMDWLRITPQYRLSVGCPTASTGYTVPYPCYLGGGRPYRRLCRKTLRSPHLSKDACTVHQRRGCRRALRDGRPHTLPPACIRLARRNPGGKPEEIGSLRILFT